MMRWLFISIHRRLHAEIAQKAQKNLQYFDFANNNLIQMCYFMAQMINDLHSPGVENHAKK